MNRITNLSKGDKIGYNPVGTTDVRQVGIVKEVNLVRERVIVALPDDPGIEERVPFSKIQAIE